MTILKTVTLAAVTIAVVAVFVFFVAPALGIHVPVPSMK